MENNKNIFEKWLYFAEQDLNFAQSTNWSKNY